MQSLPTFTAVTALFAPCLMLPEHSDEFVRDSHPLPFYPLAPRRTAVRGTGRFLRIQLQENYTTIPTNSAICRFIGRMNKNVL